MKRYRPFPPTQYAAIKKKHVVIVIEKASQTSHAEQFTFHSVECKQIEDIINAMPSNKAPGIDKDIKDCLPIILPFVTSIINASLSSSTFPGIWKTAEITSIPK